ncbi:ABC transporter permease [Microbacterium sp. 4-7]|uniref:ABC transporter permease n=1 Tax=Microbacterium sp. 4-7 TaxID=1885327 RepID=UPI0016508BD0|nr:ABC transporter permease [Microbacterium sp. 4-7]MBC6496688.1 hypothetical protein [Microbacterium sp. 4-7]
MSTSNTSTSRASITGAIKGEWIKLFGMRSNRWLIALAIIVPLLAIVIWALNANPASSSSFDESNAVLGSVTSSLFEALVLFVLFGALVGTSEYDTRTISTTMVAVPRRWPIVVAKAVVVAVTTATVSIVVLLVGFLLASVIVPTSAPVTLAEPGLIPALAGTALFQVCAALISLFLGITVRSSIGAIAGAFGFFYVIPGVINLVSIPAIQAFGHSFPGPASDSLTVLTAPAGGLPYGVAAIALVLWTGIWLLIALRVTTRRDV